MIEQVRLVDDQDRGPPALGCLAGQGAPGLDGEGGGAVGGLAAEGGDHAGVDAAVILSFRVSWGCDLRRPVVDSVADGTLAA
jgi:hypothetical protein